MVPKFVLLFAFIATWLFGDVSSRPSNFEVEPLRADLPDLTEAKENSEKEEKSIYYQSHPSADIVDETTRDIVSKIQAINNGLKKPPRQQINYNKPQIGGSYTIDAQILEKIQQAIASGKINAYGTTQNRQETNDILNVVENFKRYLYSRSLRQPTFAPPQPYIVTVPVVVMPPPSTLLPWTDNIPPISSEQMNRMRQDSYFPNFSFPSFPFQNFQSRWPFAQYFPVIIKDPFLAFTQSGGWNNLIEYGQNADVCSRKQKATDDLMGDNEMNLKNEINVESNLVPIQEKHSRKARALKKRTINQRSATQDVEEHKQAKKIYVTRPNTPNTKTKTTKKPYIVQEVEEVKNEESGDLRFPFGDFSWFGNKKPVAPSPGFFINKLRVRKGGVAIAGPGGVATAGRGGTAIVGPGGLAYTQPGGLAVAGPAARVVALAPDADLGALVTRIHRDSDPSVPRSQQPIREGKVVATGPVVYYHSDEQTDSTQYLPFYGGAKGQYLEIRKDTSGSVLSEKIVPEDSISNENILKNSEDNVQAKVFAANLGQLRTLSASTLRTLGLGRRLGYLAAAERDRFRTQLAALAETASNTVKIVDEIGEDIDGLFNKTKPDASSLRKYGENYDDDVGEEGISIGAADEPGGDDFLDKATIAEAKPVGLAVIGESGLAASRPVATAVAASGVALARPIATAIAGLDPTLLGIDFQHHHQRASKVVRGKSAS